MVQGKGDRSGPSPEAVSSQHDGAGQAKHDTRGPERSASGGILPLSTFLTGPSDRLGKPVCRLGLATRGGSSAITPDDVLDALERGVNFLNWPGEADTPGGADAISEAVASLGRRRESVVVCVQFGARTADQAASELSSILAILRTDFIDVLTFYYVETAAEWRLLSGPGGALAYCQAAKRDGLIRSLGITSHQRPLAAEIARSRLIDALMIRYNAAHRGAEREVFPVTDALGMPVITYTALRWGALLQSTPEDPPGFRPLRAPQWYRFVLQSPSVAVTLAAPTDRAELDEDLSVLQATGPMAPDDYARLAAHGERVRRHAGRFP
jgi:predicted aldo/keto reductase-like oxidoreductase